jgi:hypothetical protein
MLLCELARCEYIDSRENVLFVGNPGTRKTLWGTRIPILHLSSASLGCGDALLTPLHARGVQILDRARLDDDSGHCWRLASHA